MRSTRRHLLPKDSADHVTGGIFESEERQQRRKKVARNATPKLAERETSAAQSVFVREGRIDLLVVEEDFTRRANNPHFMITFETGGKLLRWTIGLAFE